MVRGCSASDRRGASEWPSSTSRRISRVDLLRGRLGDVLGLGDRVAEEDLLLVLAVADRPELVAHAPLGDHVAGDLGRLLDVGGGAGGHLVAAEHLLLGDPAAHGDGDVGLELLAA